MTQDTIFWLQKWFCDLKKNKGMNANDINIHNIDNPGWRFTINLEKTPFAVTAFSETRFQGKNKDDWSICFVREKKFESACGPRNLPQVLEMFRK